MLRAILAAIAGYIVLFMVTAVVFTVAWLALGSSFAFEEAWPDLRTALLAGNVSPFAMVRKLGDLGVPGAGKAPYQ